MIRPRPTAGCDDVTRRCRPNIAPSPASGRRTTAARDRRRGAVQCPGSSRSRVRRPATTSAVRSSSSAASRSNTSPSRRSASSTSTSRARSVRSKNSAAHLSMPASVVALVEPRQQQQRAPRRGDGVDVDVGFGSERAAGDVGEHASTCRCRHRRGSVHRPVPWRLQRLRAATFVRRARPACCQRSFEYSRRALELPKRHHARECAGRGPVRWSRRTGLCAAATAAARSAMLPIWISTRSGRVIARPAACIGDAAGLDAERPIGATVVEVQDDALLKLSEHPSPAQRARWPSSSRW